MSKRMWIAVVVTWVVVAALFTGVAINLYHDQLAREDPIFQLTTDDNNEVVSLHPSESTTNIQWLFRIDDWDSVKQWCEDKTDCHELAIEADGEIHYFTYKELINYAKTRTTKGDKK